MVKKNYNLVKTIIFSDLKMNEGGQVRTRTEGLKGASRYPVRVGLRDRVDVDHLLKFWVVFGGILFLSKGEY